MNRRILTRTLVLYFVLALLASKAQATFSQPLHDDDCEDDHGPHSNPISVQLPDVVIQTPIKHPQIPLPQHNPGRPDVIIDNIDIKAPIRDYGSVPAPPIYKPERPNIYIEDVDIHAPIRHPNIPAPPVYKPDRPDVIIDEIDIKTPIRHPSVPDAPYQHPNRPGVIIDQVDIKTPIRHPNIPDAPYQHPNRPDVIIEDVNIKTPIRHPNIPDAPYQHPNRPSADIPDINIKTPIRHPNIPDAPYQHPNRPQVELPDINIKTPIRHPNIPDAPYQHPNRPDVVLPDIDIKTPIRHPNIPDAPYKHPNRPIVVVPKVTISTHKPFSLIPDINLDFGASKCWGHLRDNYRFLNSARVYRAERQQIGNGDNYRFNFKYRYSQDVELDYRLTLFQAAGADIEIVGAEFVNIPDFRSAKFRSLAPQSCAALGEIDSIIKTRLRERLGQAQQIIDLRAAEPYYIVTYGCDCGKRVRVSLLHDALRSDVQIYEANEFSQPQSSGNIRY